MKNMTKEDLTDVLRKALRTNPSLDFLFMLEQEELKILIGGAIYLSNSK
jgi:hypothetical protein